MCSVIEIKNSSEYYIHYHSPESLDPNMSEEDKKKKFDKNAEKESGHEDDEDSVNSNDMEKDCSVGEVEQKPKTMMISKETEVTSDRGSSLEGEESNHSEKDKKLTTKVKITKERARSLSPSTGHHCSEVPITVNSHIPASPERIKQGNAEDEIRTVRASSEPRRNTVEIATQVETKVQEKDKKKKEKEEKKAKKKEKKMARKESKKEEKVKRKDSKKGDEESGIKKKFRLVSRKDSKKKKNDEEENKEQEGKDKGKGIITHYKLSGHKI